MEKREEIVCKILFLLLLRARNNDDFLLHTVEGSSC